MKKYFILVFLSFTDILSTVYLLENNFVYELNPIMNYLINYNIYFTIFFKIILSIIVSIIFYINKDKIINIYFNFKTNNLFNFILLCYISVNCLHIYYFISFITK